MEKEFASWHTTAIFVKNAIFSGLLGTITKTADSSECPGKCIHALASLLCDEVREDIQCPSEGLRCCIDRRRPKPPQQQQQPKEQQPQQESGSKSNLDGKMELRKDFKKLCIDLFVYRYGIIISTGCVKSFFIYYYYYFS